MDMNKTLKNIKDFKIHNIGLFGSSRFINCINHKFITSEENYFTIKVLRDKLFNFDFV